MSAIPTDIIEQLAAARVAQAETTSAPKRDEAEVRARIRAQKAADDKAAQARARRVGHDAGVKNGADLGHSARSDIEATAWRDPTDSSANKRQARTIQGARRVDILVTLARRGSPVTLRHIAGANRFRLDYEIGILGGRPGRDPDAAPRDPGKEAPDPEAIRLDVLGRYTRATKAVGIQLSAILVHVVLAGLDVASFSALRGIKPEHAMGYLVAALDCLAEFYDISESISARDVDPLSPDGLRI